MGLFESVVHERQEFYRNNPEKRSKYKEAEQIVATYALTNAGIAGAMNIIPGPWGMTAVIPEIIIIIRNQLKMIYDIGIALGQPEYKLTKEVLLGIMTSATGTASTGMLTIHGGKVLVKRSSLRVMQKIIAMLGGRISQRMLKSVVSKWLPVVGAVAMAGWINYSTKKIGKIASHILINEIEFLEDRALPAAPIEETPTIQVNQSELENKKLLLAKLSALLNLIKIDGDIDEREKAFIEPLIANAPFSEHKKAVLRKHIDSPNKFKVNYELFKNKPEEATALLIDLVALAKADEKFHPAEKMYIRQIGKTLELPDEDISWLCS